MAVTRILIVDDFHPWLSVVRRIFQSEADFSIIATATDGLEAVAKAAELRPDVILMDLGLPGINGLEAARQIRPLSPSSKILFLSQDHSPDLTAAAFEAGALGYVWKSDCDLDLIAGIKAILSGERFVSRTLANKRIAE